MSQPLSLRSDEMIAELYSELRKLASARMNQLPPGQTLQATALVHEAYVRLSRDPAQHWENRAHFFAAAAEAMRRVLVEQARRKSALKRSAGSEHLLLDQIDIRSPEPEDRLLAVHDFVDALALENPIHAQVVKLRFFAGLEHAEIAVLLECSEKTVRRHWNTAKLWLYQRIKSNNN